MAESRSHARSNPLWPGLCITSFFPHKEKCEAERSELQTGLYSEVLGRDLAEPIGLVTPPSPKT